MIDRVKSINSTVDIIPTQQSQVALDQILNIHSFDLEKVMKMDPQFLADQEHEHDNSGNANVLEYDYNLIVTSVGIEFEGEINQDLLNKWLGKFLKEKGADIFRMKGILAIENIKHKFVFQGNLDNDDMFDGW